MDIAFEKQITELIEKHIPVLFLDYESVQQTKNILCFEISWKGCGETLLSKKVSPRPFQKIKRSSL